LRLMNTNMIDISVVIPAYNEAPSLEELYRKLTAVLVRTGKSYELIFVNDGSSDDSLHIIDKIVDIDPYVSAIHFRRNFGKAAALNAGFRIAKGNIVFTIDADLQDNPQEIPKFLRKIDDGNDMVTGWKEKRKDPLSKTIPSRLFNYVVSKCSGLKLNDYNCGFKAYRWFTLENLNLYGELHRFIPMLLHCQGYSIAEVSVRHNERQYGHSKYGASRLLKGFLDLLTVLLMTRYIARPLHLFGGIGAVISGMGSLILFYLTTIWLVGIRPIGNRPLLFLGILLVVVGIQFVSTGLLGELISHEQQAKSPNYIIRSVRHGRKQQNDQLPKISK